MARRVLEPQTAAEAWNVIRLATGNVDALLAEERLGEIPVQISLCSPALRALPGLATRPQAVGKLEAQMKRAFTSLNAVAAAAQQRNGAGAKGALASLRLVLGELAGCFDAKVTEADIFLCPMHADCLAENAKTPCAKCGMDMVRRRIPASFIYTKPGEPTVRMTVQADAPVEAGRAMAVKVWLRRADGSAVTRDDLMVMHTEPIHLLIEEPGLGDYHHEHPAPTGIPGEYVFTFTPKKTVAYRIWADIVPMATGVQELPFADLPSEGKGGVVEAGADRFISTVGGYQFALTFPTGGGLATKAGQARPMGVTVTDEEGRPVTTLEPVMNAFCHLVGFYDDYRTVVHLHPTGGDVLNADLRGGPSLGFLLYAPRAGFMRLYCQVRIGGRMIFAPFDVNVEP